MKPHRPNLLALTLIALVALAILAAFALSQKPTAPLKRAAGLRDSRPSNAHAMAPRRGLRSLREVIVALLAAGGLSLASGCGTSQAPNGTQPSQGQGGPLVTRGRALYQADGCAGCHSLNGTRLTGPSWKGLTGSQVKLGNGRTVTADDAYLARHIAEPNALTVQGYPSQVMAQAIETLDLKDKPSDVRALVAFIDSLR